LRQVVNLSNLPFAFQHVALMPDAHTGYGMPIGGVLATQDVIIPNAVGVDIGCGMGFVHTNVPAGLLRDVKTPNGTLAQHLVGQIMRDVPQGFEHHRHRQESEFLDRFPVGTLYHYGNEKLPTLDEAYLQLGTLGGGNHFIELQEDEQGYLGIMVHTGSRNVGFKVANYFNRLAKGLNRAIELQKVLTQEFEISAIFSTPLKRTQQTATPTTAFYSLDIQEYDHKKPTVLKELILSDYKGKTVLIAGHSNSTPILVNHFFGEDKYPYLSEDVFNQMFIVRIAEDGKVKVVQRSYGAENE